jgi:hypothetical protein
MALELMEAEVGGVRILGWDGHFTVYSPYYAYGKYKRRLSVHPLGFSLLYTFSRKMPPKTSNTNSRAPLSKG